MRQKRHSTRVVVAALTALLTSSLAVASGLVLCLGSDGHSAIELDHRGMECPTLVASRGATGISAQTLAECVDLPAAGTGPMTPTSFDAERVPVPTVAFLAVSLEPTRRIETPLPAWTDARAGPVDLALQLRSTVLLV